MNEVAESDFDKFKTAIQPKWEELSAYEGKSLEIVLKIQEEVVDSNSVLRCVKIVLMTIIM